jgi:hypothetical protein
MKKILIVLCLLSTAAFAQNMLGGNSLSNQPQAYQFQSHTAHATYAPMSQEQTVLPTTPYLSAQGERSPSDFSQVEGVSLGTVARELRKQRTESKKSRVIWVNQ